ncbi:MAG: hypothetical protein C0443_11785 [Comamonadaceae bacterium]|nr:hypothetical protein [Comamonadaceae bacterium]
MGRQLVTTKSAAHTPKTMNIPMAPDSGDPATASPSATSFDREQAVREAAYACFEARGCEPGHELDDWLKAEALVQQANGGAAPTAH